MTESQKLDAAFLSEVHAWAHGGACGFADEEIFDRHARALFAYQIERNAPYARFAASRGFDRAHLPASWREMPAVPTAAFKDATLATFDVHAAELAFHTSGTTAARSGKHYAERAALYDAALLAAFDRFMLADRAKVRFLNLVPDPRSKTHSSLGYMMGHVSVLRGDGKASWFLEDAGVRVDAFVKAMQTAITEKQAVCIAGTAFALVALLDGLDERGITFTPPTGSRIMETGGFKGRSRVLSREDLYARLESRLGIAQKAIIAEYGMTELTSQYYDTFVSRSEALRVKAAPPWLRTLVVDTEGREVTPGVTGFLRHIDLGNRSSVLAVQTEDRGYAVTDGIVLLGRESDAPPRGCSLTLLAHMPNP
jgi:Acyl-protein synthetase, LuxE